MTTRHDHTQVIVVGAGPVGLMLAGELRLGGVDVIVAERLAEPTTESRASTLHARTMEILDSRGLLDRFGELPSDVRGHFGGIPLDLTLPGPFPGQWKSPQTHTEAVLARWAGDLGARVLRGHTVTDLAVGGDGVAVTATGPDGQVHLHGEYVVGCDGEQSTVRRLAGISFPGQDAGRELLRADVEGITIPDRRFQRLAAGLAIAARRGDGVTRVMVHEFGRGPAERTRPVDFTDVARTWQRVTGERIDHGTPLWVNSFGDASRQAARYRKGRVLLAGDAAHQQMPIGGQALNLGLQDAVNLGWKLALVVRGRVAEDLLDTYDDERRTVGARVLSNINAQAMLLLGAPEVEPMRTVLAELIGHDRVRQRLAGMISGLDVDYGRGPADHPLVGARLLPARLRGAVATADPTSTAALLRGGRGLLLDLSGDDGRHARLRREAARWSDRVDIVAARPDGQQPPWDADAVLVRPDGYVAWAGTTGPGDALRRWFGTPGQAPHPIVIPTTTDSTLGSTDMDTLANKTALVTGASRGIGRAVAVRLAERGALVAVHYNTNKDLADEVVATIEKDGGRAFAVRAELGAPGDVHELFLGLEQGLKERTGSTELNILVNNAGVMGGSPADQLTPEQFDRLMAVNAKAPFFIIQRAMANLAPGGRVVNISSGLTHVANPDEIAYAMSKGAVEQLALHFARLLAPRQITINSVAPGITRNGSPVFDIPEAVEQMAKLSAFNRVGEPEDVADVVAFLASDDARWITGAFLDATGGTLLG